ncbi:LD-carboxypeptidase [Kitasatospora purpeofusca]|uniref:S66 peptidase family protein n=1 Tax=Kitasatospora purpeofusca TaxID=67352 RepID=UPI0035DB9070
MPPLLRPRALSPGDVVAVAAPSGPLDGADAPLLARGIGTLRQLGFEVRDSAVLAAGRPRWWAAGSPAAQAEELNALLRDPQVRGVIAHTGGQATLGYLDLLDLDAIRADPKPLLGCSDISLLLLALYGRTGLAGIHADMATYGLGSSWHTVPGRNEELAALHRRLLTVPEPLGALPAMSGWECWRAGRAEGPLVGGLLDRLTSLQATPYALPAELFDGAVLFWEEVERPLSAVWSDLHVLRLSGVLDRIAAMVVGVPHRLTAPGCAHGTPELREVVLDVLGGRDLPVLGQVDIGHAGPNLPLPLGIRAEVDATARTLTLLEAAVTVRPSGTLRTGNGPRPPRAHGTESVPHRPQSDS